MANTFIIFFTSIFICYAQWEEIINPLMPRPDKHMACASYNDTIFIFGGFDHTKQFFQYIISNNTMLDQGESLAEMIFSFGAKFWHQTSHTLYIYNDPDTKNFTVSLVYIYDMRTNEFWNNHETIISHRDLIYGRSCTTGTDIYLTVTGGWHDGVTKNQVYIMWFENNTWSKGPSMQKEREGHGCCFVSDVYMLLAETFKCCPSRKYTVMICSKISRGAPYKIL
eukprot:597914_1